MRASPLASLRPAARRRQEGPLSCPSSLPARSPGTRARARVRRRTCWQRGREALGTSCRIPGEAPRWRCSARTPRRMRSRPEATPRAPGTPSRRGSIRRWRARRRAPPCPCRWVRSAPPRVRALRRTSSRAGRIGGTEARGACRCAAPLRASPSWETLAIPCVPPSSALAFAAAFKHSTLVEGSRWAAWFLRELGLCRGVFLKCDFELRKHQPGVPIRSSKES